LKATNDNSINGARTVSVMLNSMVLLGYARKSEKQCCKDQRKCC